MTEKNQNRKQQSKLLQSFLSGLVQKHLLTPLYNNCLLARITH